MDVPSYIPTGRGGNKALYKGYVYTKHRTGASSSTWHCTLHFFYNNFDFSSINISSPNIMSPKIFRHQIFCHQKYLSPRVFVTKDFCHQAFLSPKIFVTKGFCHQKFVTMCTVTMWPSPSALEPTAATRFPWSVYKTFSFFSIFSKYI